MGSINLSEFVENPYTNNAFFNTTEFVKAVKIGVRALDRLIDENYDKHPLKEQQEMSYNYRNIGLGVFGYATCLMKLGLEYGSKEAIDFTDTIFGLMFRSAVIESNEMAKEAGPFPNYNSCLFDSDIMVKHFPMEERAKMAISGLKNCSLISIAPTGSIATMLGESGGCEPEFAIKYTRRTVGMTEGEDTYYDIYCKAAKEYMKVNNTDKLPNYFVSAYDIPWRNRIRTQAIMQQHVDTGISSTINLPNNSTVHEVKELYLSAWEEGLKGVTIFREGCKRMPILKTENKEKNDIHEVGKIRKLTTGCGSLHLTAFFNSETGDLMEIFLNKGSSGGCNNFMIGLSRIVSLSAKQGCTIYEIIDQLESCGVCPSYAVRTATKHDTSIGSSCPVAVGKALKEMWEEMQNDIFGKNRQIFANALSKEINDGNVTSSENCKTEYTPFSKNERKKSVRTSAYDGKTCPICHSQIEHEGGCDQCKNCGWSKCE